MNATVWTGLLADKMSYAGWTVMLISIGSVLLLVGFCLYRVLTLPPVDFEEIKGPATIDTGDRVDRD